MICQLCEREVSKLSGHHLVPKKILKRKGTDKPKDKLKAKVCVDCTKMIHAFHRHKELAKKYDSIILLKKSPKMQRYLNWIKNKPEGIVKHPRRMWIGGPYE